MSSTFVSHSAVYIYVTGLHFYFSFNVELLWLQWPGLHEMFVSEKHMSRCLQVRGSVMQLYLNECGALMRQAVGS